VLRRLETLGLIESLLAGNERTYRTSSSSTSSSPQTASEEPEGGEYESPERLAEIREERIPQHVREERDADRLWEAQHRQRTLREAEVLEQQAAAVQAPLEPASKDLELPEVGEVVEITDGRGGWAPGYRVTAASPQEIILISERSGRKVHKTPSSSRSPWRRPNGPQQLLLAG